MILNLSTDPCSFSILFLSHNSPSKSCLNGPCPPPHFPLFPQPKPAHFSPVSHTHLGRNHHQPYLLPLLDSWKSSLATSPTSTPKSKPAFKSVNQIVLLSLKPSFGFLGFPGGNACNAGDLASAPGSGRSPGEENGNPLLYSSLENPMDRGTWRTRVHRVATDTLRHDWSTHTHTHTHGFLVKLEFQLLTLTFKPLLHLTPPISQMWSTRHTLSQLVWVTPLLFFFIN